MKNKNQVLRRSLTAFALTLCMLFSVLAPTVMAAAPEQQPTVNDTSNEPINYVSLGASNVNGYGMRGYVPIDAYNTPLEKEFLNVYGYKSNVPGSYPVLFADKLSEKYNTTVNLSQLAMSSMRAEEIRFLLDPEFESDSYTKWRFYDPTTEEVSYSKNWFYGAGRIEWEALGKEGVPSNEESLATLREAYANAITNADVITVDVGMNNFGVYISLQTGSNKFGNDLNNIDSKIADKYAEGKEYVLDLISEYIDGNSDIPLDQLESVADTFAYALVGFCLNFDVIMEKIYTLNPDAQVIVISIQNLMEGLDAKVPGFDEDLPFGEIFGAVVNAANTYTSILSPYADLYSYANVSENGHVELFADEAIMYGGNSDSISQDMKDCFDVYDNSIFLKTRILQMFAIQLNAQGLVSMEDYQKDISSESGLVAFYNGYHYDRPYRKVPAMPTITLVDGTPLKDFIALGDAGMLTGEYKAVYDVYANSIEVAYDVMTEIMKEGAQIKTVDLLSISKSWSAANDLLLNSFFQTVVTAITKSAADPSYEFDINKEYPDGFFNAVAAAGGIDVAFLNTVVALGVRGDIGNSFFAHPNANGHEQICDAILSAYENNTSGKSSATVTLENLYNLYNFVANSGLLDNYPEIAVIEDIYLYLDYNGYITDEQTLNIILYVLDRISDKGLSDEDSVSIVKYVYETLICNPDLSDKDRVDIIITIYSILKLNGYLDGYSELKIAEIIYSALMYTGLFDDSDTFAIFDYIVRSLMEGKSIDLIAFLRNRQIEKIENIIDEKTAKLNEKIAEIKDKANALESKLEANIEKLEVGIEKLSDLVVNKTADIAAKLDALAEKITDTASKYLDYFEE